MRKFPIVVLALALPCAAHAAAVQDKGPYPAGGPHTCGQFYPEKLDKDGAEGTTTLSFRVTADGKTKALAVAKSSGNGDLDAAAITCASGWLYTPAIKDGKPVEAPWQAAVQWKVRSPDEITPPKPAAAHVCDNYPHGAAWDDAEGKAVVAFRVAADGTVNTPEIVQSTGNAELDAAALKCVTAWRYQPATRMGAPVEIEWRAQVDWRVHDTGEPDAPCMRYLAAPSAKMLAGIRGVTRLSYRIMPDGSTSDATVERSSGSDVLDKAALRCIGEMHMDVRKARLPPAGVSNTSNIDWHVGMPKG